MLWHWRHNSLALIHWYMEFIKLETISFITSFYMKWFKVEIIGFCAVYTKCIKVEIFGLHTSFYVKCIKVKSLVFKHLAYEMYQCGNYFFSHIILYEIYILMVSVHIMVYSMKKYIYAFFFFKKKLHKFHWFCISRFPSWILLLYMISMWSLYLFMIYDMWTITLLT